MKKNYFLLFAIAFMLLFSPKKINAQEINSEFNKIINDLVENYNQQNFKAIRKDFSDQLGAVFNETTTTEMFTGLYTDLGKIVNRESSEIKSPYEIDVLVVFEKNAEELVISFTFSDNNEILGLSLYSPEAAKINYPEITKSTTIEEIVASYLEKNKNSSLIIGIYDNGEEKFLKFGKNKNSDKFNVNSIYEIGSVTKTFTATLLAIMVENGEMSYNDPISKHLPDSIPKLIKPNGKEITLEELATHTSGLPRLPENLEETIKNPLNPYNNYYLENLYDYLKTVKVGTSTYEYSNLGMGLLGEILARHSKMTYEELVKKYITEELGMNNTEIKLSESQKQNFLKGYNIEGNPTPHWDFNTLEGAGAIRSTAKDMMNYLKSNLGVNDDNLKDILAKTHKRRNQETALGWHLMQFNENEIVWHNGATYGFSSFIAFDKVNKKGVFILSNSGNIVDEMGIALLELMSL